jgi:hypothetical protein
MDVMATDLSAIQSGVFGFWPWRYAGGSAPVVTVNFAVVGCGSGGDPMVGATCNLILGGSTVATGTTDASGNCTLTWTSGGAFTFQVVLPSGTGYAAPSNQTATLALGATSNRTFILSADSTHACWHDPLTGLWHLMPKTVTIHDPSGTATLTFDPAASPSPGWTNTSRLLHTTSMGLCSATMPTCGSAGISGNMDMYYYWHPGRLDFQCNGCQDGSGIWWADSDQTPSSLCVGGMAGTFNSTSYTFSPIADSFSVGSGFGNIFNSGPITIS